MSSTAVRRLQRDLNELTAEEKPPFVHARPSGNGEDLFNWSATFVADAGQWAGVPVHVHIEFPSNYPLTPPRVSMVTRGLVHPNVFGDGYICLDMLNLPELEWGGMPYRGWSSAYTVSAVMMQLYGFLLADDKIDQDHGGSVARADCRRNSRLTRDSAIEQLRKCACGVHELPQPEQEQPPPPAARSQHATPSPFVDLDDLPADVLDQIVGRLDAITVTNLVRATGDDTQTRAIAVHHRNQMNLFCFHSKDRHDDGRTVLGYPINVVLFNDENVRNMSIAGYDFLGYAAYKDGKVRMTAWNTPFTDFLPVYLNPKHGARALQVLKTTVKCDLVFAMGKLMNGMLVDLCKEDAPSNSRRMLCDSAVEAFFHMHHLLLAVALSDATILKEAEREVIAFANGSTHKRTSPDLGVVLIYTLLVPAARVPWSHFVRPFFRELLTRQVRWVNAPDFTTVYTDRSDEWRIDTHLASACKSLRIVTMSAWFANSVARPRKSVSELAAIKAALDAAHGQPPQATRDRFWAVFKTLERGERFSDYLNVIGVCPKPLPTHRATLARMLRQAVVDSQKAKYHRARLAPPSHTFARFDASDLDVYTGYDV